MAKKKTVDEMVSELLQNRMEIVLHRELRKARKVRTREREKTKEQMLELKALPLPVDIIDVHGEEVEAKDTSEAKEQKPCP